MSTLSPEQSKGEAAQPIPSIPGFMLHETSRLLQRRFEQNARSAGLTRAQWQALSYLKHMEGCTQKELAEVLEIEPITLARILDRLQEAGLVERRADARDRRLWRLHLAGAAWDLLRKIQPMWQATRDEALEGLAAEDVAHFVRILQQIKSNLAEATTRPPAITGDTP